MTQQNMMLLNRWLDTAMPPHSPEEQRASLVLLAELANGEPITTTQFAAALGAPPDEAEGLLTRPAFRPFVYAGDDGRILGFHGLSVTHTHHQFAINGRTLWAWCAGDTLFLPALLGKTARVESRDPESGEQVRLTISPERIEAVEPSEVWNVIPPTGHD